MNIPAAPPAASTAKKPPQLHPASASLAKALRGRKRQRGAVARARRSAGGGVHEAQQPLPTAAEVAAVIKLVSAAPPGEREERKLKPLVAALAATLPFCACLPKPALSRFAECCQVAQFAHGARVLNEGAPVDRLLVCVAGAASLYVRGSRAGEALSGDAYGGPALLHGAPAAIGIRVDDDAGADPLVALWVGKDEFAYVFEGVPAPCCCWRPRLAVCAMCAPKTSSEALGEVAAYLASVDFFAQLSAQDRALLAPHARLVEVPGNQAVRSADAQTALFAVVAGGVNALTAGSDFEIASIDFSELNGGPSLRSGDAFLESAETEPETGVPLVFSAAARARRPSGERRPSAERLKALRVTMKAAASALRPTAPGVVLPPAIGAVLVRINGQAADDLLARRGSARPLVWRLGKLRQLTHKYVKEGCCYCASVLPLLLLLLLCYSHCYCYY